MTEVEFSRLLAELSETAKVLNRESDSTNDLIAGLEKTLHGINLGLEVWLDDALESEAVEEEGRDGEYYETGTVHEELGFTRLGRAWRLVVRSATYKYDAYQRLQFKNATDLRELTDCSRDLRIEALKRFPELVAQMTAKAAAAVKAIEDAKKFVK